MQVDHWRCLSKTMWSEVIAAKVVALVVLQFLAADHAWAQEALEIAYIEVTEQEWIAQWSLS